MADWHVGQKVCCISKFSKRIPDAHGTPEVGVVYTIRGFRNFRSNVGFLLEEIANPACWWINEAGDSELFERGYDSRRFRPVVTKDADISIFTEILDRVNKRETVDA